MNIAQSMYHNISSLWSRDANNNFINNKKLLELGNIIQSLDSGSMLDKRIPKMVVVGTQSSGKSSVLNRILRMDILPVGKQMVTRTPLHMELNQRNTGDLARVEFGTYSGSGKSWHITHELNVTIPEPSVADMKRIESIINEETCKRAGDDKNISKTPITMRIFSPNVPTLTLVDLPGLTSVACRDRGQPADIKEQIIDLASLYIRDPRYLILGVMAARDDLETDMALELIKRYEPEGDRTIGIITKIDLMNRGSDVNHYLEGSISSDLGLKYGYFAIKNRSLEERERMTALESLKNEMDYFNKNISYKCRDRLGLSNVERVLSNITIGAIRDNLPIIRKTINDELSSTRELLQSFGKPIGDSVEERHTLLYYATSTFNKIYNKSLEERGTQYNIGRKIRDIFINFRKEVMNKIPFEDRELYTDEYIREAIYDCEGNHMSTLSLPIDVLERCIRDNTRRPLFTVMDICNRLCDNIFTELVQLVDLICEEKSLSRFPLLVSTIRSRLKMILGELTEDTRKRIYEIVEVENNYIWTDKDEFLTLFQNVLKRSCFKIDVNGIREILSSYYMTYVDTIGVIVPKLIMYHLVTRSEHIIAENLSCDITRGIDLKELIAEPDEVRKERLALQNKVEGLERGMSILSEFK